MSRPRLPLGDQRGRLLAAMLRALVAELCEPTRYSRAKTYARDNAVVDIEVRPQLVVGSVLGSRPTPYVARVQVDTVAGSELDAARDAGAAQRALTSLLPTPDELSVSCDCPDFEPGMLCKHVASLVLVLADELSIEPELLVRWRTSADSGDDVLDDDGYADDLGSDDGDAWPSLARLPARPVTTPRQASAAHPARRTPPAAAHRAGRRSEAPASVPERVDLLAGLVELRRSLPALPVPQRASVIRFPGRHSPTAPLDELLTECAVAFSASSTERR